jgi:Rieske Fe-S protein
MADRVLTRTGLLRGALVTAFGAVAGYLTARTSSAAGGMRGTTAANAYGPPTGSATRLLIPLDQVPHGGGVILSEDDIVLTRASSGDVHAFSAVCTHQGCTVDTVAAGSIDCPCHGSSFDADTGAVISGPASRPLPPIAVVVRDGQVFSS